MNPDLLKQWGSLGVNGLPYQIPIHPNLVHLFLDPNKNVNGHPPALKNLTVRSSSRLLATMYRYAGCMFSVANRL